MKESQLRIGNFVYKNGVIGKVNTYDFIDVKNPLNEFLPVFLMDLGEKLLIDNFRPTGEEGWYEINSYLEINIEFGVFNDDSFVGRFTELHRFQNFYESITGKELKVNL